MSTNVVMPQLGESVVEGAVGQWFKQVGDHIEQYEPIMEVITDKVTTEIPSPASGTLLQIIVPAGTTVKAGTVLALIGQPGEESAPISSPTPNQAPIPNIIPTAPLSSPAISTPERANGGTAMRLTPVVSRMIIDFNITAAELKSIRGTGENGRVSKKDLENFLKTRQPQAPTPAPTDLPAWEQPGSGDLFRPTEELFNLSVVQAQATLESPPPGDKVSEAQADELIPHTPIRRAIAEHMVRSKTNAPHVTTVHEADMTNVLAHFNAHQQDFTRQGAKLTYTPYLIQAAVFALQAVPLVNAQFTDAGILMKRALNIGIAVAIDDGLIVPVIKNADEKSLLGLARAVNELASAAREHTLSPPDVQGGTFTITNYGVFGSLFGTPIINQPQSAILGVGAIQKRAVVINDAIAIRPMVYLALSFDHRLLDGATGDRFMTKFKDFLENYPAA